MTRLWIDTETYSEQPIADGAYKYAESVEIMLWAYALDDGPVAVWDLTTGAPMPDDLAATLADESVEVWAHNSAFDRTMIAAFLGDMAPALSRWRDTMVKAYAHGLPGGLAMLGAALGLSEDQQKMKDGKQLVLLFCKPRPANSKVRRATRETHPEQWAQFVAYAGQDIETMRECDKRMPVWNYQGAELALWHLDQLINDRGVAIDVELAQTAVATATAAKRDLARRAKAMTGGAVENATQRDALLQHVLEEYGVTLPDMQKGTLERRINDPDLPEPLRELLAVRLDATTTSVAKYQKFINATNSDGRLRGTLQFCGAARTGRWAGRLVQLQNLPRPAHSGEEVEQTIAAVKANCADLVFDDIMPRLSSAIRGCIVAPAGKKLVVADLSNIEGRVLAWLAGENWKLRAFAEFDAGTGFDLYILAYARAYGMNPEDVAKAMRQIGKVMELALGYQGAVGAFSSMAALYGVVLPEAKVLEIVKAWRAANSEISDFWYDLERTTKLAIGKPGTTLQCRRLKVRRDGNWLRIGLPSGRALCYPGVRLDDEGKVTYMGVNQYTRKWERLHTYGGKLVENATQAVARDVLASAMPVCEEQGYQIVTSVHDELLTEAPDSDEYSDKALAAIMASNPTWADGLPLAAAGFETYRYRKD